MTSRRLPRASSPMDTDELAIDSTESTHRDLVPASNVLGLFVDSGHQPHSVQRVVKPTSHDASRASARPSQTRIAPVEHSIPSASASGKALNIDATSDALSHLSLSPEIVRKSLAPSVSYAASSHRERSKVPPMPRPGSRALSLTLSAPSSPVREGPSAAHNFSPRLSAVPSIDTDQHMDVYDTIIEPALELMGIAGIHALREHQASAITHALNNENLFLALATGAGKSLCFQIPAIIQARHEQRVTIVLQPTLEIITSQVKALSAHGIDVEIFSSLTTSEDKNAVAERLNLDGYRPALLYTTSDSFFGHYHYVFTTLHDKGALARIVMDEGHTILHWKDFRPLMDHLKTISTRFSGVPITIATASLTLADRTNLLNHLSIPPSSCRIISGSLDRPNLVYTVQPIHTFKSKRKLQAIYDFLKDQFGLRPESWRTQPKKAGIIYCATASHCDEVKKAINKAYGDDFAITAYGERHGMDREAQRAAVKKWMDGDVQVLVATIAFGMGIDKPDVAFVIHYDMPKTLENYIQETGRAGRNGDRALCLLLLSWQDVQRTVFYAERTALYQGDPSLSTTGAAKAFAMAQYAYTLTTCRHSQLLAHFGAALSTLQPCDNGCDNCIKKEQLTTLVVSNTARHIIELFESEPIRAKGGVHGMKYIINTLRGSTGKEVLPDKEQLGPVVGKARKVAYMTVEAVFGMLLAHGVLRGMPVAKVGDPHWGTNLRYSLGTRTLEAELYEDTEHGRQVVLRTFAAASNDSMVAPVDDDDDASPTRKARTRGKRRARTPSSDEGSHQSDPEDDDDLEEHPGLSQKARGKLPERALGSRSTFSSLTPITPGNSQSTSDSPRKRQRESNTSSPRKRGRIDSDDEFVGASVSPSQSLAATRPQRQKQIPARVNAMRELDDDDEDRPRRISRQHRIRDASELPIEIFDSSEEESRARLSRRAPAPSDESPRKKPSKPNQKTRQAAAKKTKVARKSATTARGADVELIPDVEPPPELAAAFRVLWDARRTALERYASREGPIGERDVLSDRALLALAIHQPLDYATFTAALTTCAESDPGMKWTSYGSYFRTVIRSRPFRNALPAATSSIASSSTKK